jgi:hypothetical protein
MSLYATSLNSLQIGRQVKGGTASRVLGIDANGLLTDTPTAASPTFAGLTLTGTLAGTIGAFGTSLEQYSSDATALARKESGAVTGRMMSVSTSGRVTVASGGQYGFSANSGSGNDGGNAGNADTILARKAAGIVSIDSTTAGNGLGALFMAKRTAPSAPAADGVHIYAVDNAGKTELVALFDSGAAVRIAIEP